MLRHGCTDAVVIKGRVRAQFRSPLAFFSYISLERHKFPRGPEILTQTSFYSAHFWAIWDIVITILDFIYSLKSVF